MDQLTPRVSCRLAQALENEVTGSLSLLETPVICCRGYQDRSSSTTDPDADMTMFQRDRHPIGAQMLFLRDCL